MCSKLLTRKAKSGGVCSSPRKTTRNVSEIGELAAGSDISLTDLCYHTIVLFGVPSLRAHVFRSLDTSVSKELLQLGGLHGQQLRQVEELGQICHYEWTMQQAKKTHLHQTSLVPLCGPDGKVVNVLSVTKDITGWEPAQTRVLKEGAAPHTFSQILISTRETEKRELAKSLHDEVGSTAVMLLALVSLAKQDIEQKAFTQALDCLDKLRDQIQASMARLHGVVVSIRPVGLDTDGALRGSIEELLENVCRVNHLKYDFVCHPELQEKGICDSVKILLYRVVQEALNNVVKHAHATQVTVSLERRKSRLALIIQDDGVGFKREKRLSVKHVGLLSMRESIRSIGGRLVIQTDCGQGTCIRAACPCVIYEENE